MALIGTHMYSEFSLICGILFSENLVRSLTSLVDYYWIFVNTYFKMVLGNRSGQRCLVDGKIQQIRKCVVYENI